MFLVQISTNIILFLTGVFGILLNRNHVLTILMCIELMLLALNITFILFQSYLDDVVGQILSLFVLTVAASEVAIGLAILILFFSVRFNIRVN